MFCSRREVFSSLSRSLLRARPSLFIAEKYRDGEISRDEYDKWRYYYPEHDDTQITAKVPSQELSDAMVKYNLSKELSLAIQFSPLTPEQREALRDNDHITSNVKNFVVAFEDVLSDEALASSRYAYRVLFVPINAKRKGQADQVVEFIKSDSPLAGGIEKTYAVLKETEKRKYLPSEIVALMKDKGYDKFSLNKHTEIWKARNAKDPKFNYGVLISKTWYWYETWLKEVEKYCETHIDELKS